MLAVSFDQVFGRNFDTQIHDIVTVVFQNDFHEILTDVVDIAFHRGQHDFPALRGVRFFHELFEVAHRGFHGFRRLQHFRNDQLVGIEQTPHFRHTSHQRAIDDVQRRRTFRALALQVVNEAVARALNDVICQPLVDGQIFRANLFLFRGGSEMFRDGLNVILVDGRALLFLLLAPIGGSVFQQLKLGMIGGHIFGRVRKEQVFRKLAFVLRNRSEALQFFGIHNGQVQPRLGAVIKKHGVDHFSRARGQPERHIGNSQNRTHLR